MVIWSMDLANFFFLVVKDFQLVEFHNDSFWVEIFWRVKNREGEI